MAREWVLELQKPSPFISTREGGRDHKGYKTPKQINKLTIKQQTCNINPSTKTKKLIASAL